MRISVAVTVVSTITLCMLGEREASAAPPLGAYDVDPSKVAVAGISSGGFMAVQLDVAYSSRFHGAAIFAGGPYDCAEGSFSNASGRCTTGSGIPVATLTAITDDRATKGDIDPTSGIANEPIYLFSGIGDSVVHQPVMDALAEYFGHYTPGLNITYDKTTAAGHAWISPDGPGPCGATQSPFINDCQKDAEQTFLGLFYGTLAARSTASFDSALVEFDQDAFCPGGDCSSISMDATAWAVVPPTCATPGTACKLLVAIHGCSQYQGLIGQTFVQKSGLAPWAVTNDVIVLYPQTVATSGNPFGCWDFWGYTGSDYALKSAPQMKAIMAMVDRIEGGGLPDGGTGADSGVRSDGGKSPSDGAGLGDGGAASDGGDGGGGSDGCGCRAAGSHSEEAPIAALGLVAIALTRRRRAASRRRRS